MVGWGSWVPATTQASVERGMGRVGGSTQATFNFRTVTDKFNKLVYRYPIRIPERYALVIRSLLTQARPSP